MATLVIAADWIVPVESPAISKGFLVIQDGFIVHVSDRLPDGYENCPLVRLVGGAIVPGLINAHCHLELSDIDPCLIAPANDTGHGSMVGWLNQVMARKKSIANSVVDIEEIKRKAILSGLEESWKFGTRWIIDNITAPWSADWCESWQAKFSGALKSDKLLALAAQSRLFVQPCVELVDVTQSRLTQTVEFAQRTESTLKGMSLGESANVCHTPMGLAPHAPYTASKRLVGYALRCVSSSGGILSMHLAESLEELDYADRRQGPFKQWISPWIDAEHASQIGSIQEHLQLLCTSPKALIAHGNYLGDRQIELLSSHPHQVAVVYCPRTHQHFRHSEHPARRIVKGQIPLFLGTDSKASNPDLSVFKEWQTACKAFPDLGPKFWMAACTTGPAKFLGVEKLVGTLRVGSKSLLTWVPLEHQAPETQEQLWESLLEANRAMPLECHPVFADS